jgi:hypothetical protein
MTAPRRKAVQTTLWARLHDDPPCNPAAGVHYLQNQLHRVLTPTIIESQTKVN